jgi:hypothetical protein
LIVDGVCALIELSLVDSIIISHDNTTTTTNGRNQTSYQNASTKNFPAFTSALSSPSLLLIILTFLGRNNTAPIPNIGGGVRKNVGGEKAVATMMDEEEEMNRRRIVEMVERIIV